jgi:hypothetical protein
MQTLSLTMKPLDLKHFKKRQALESDYGTFITESTVVMVDDEPRIVYVELDDVGEDCTGIVSALQKIDFDIIKGRRSGGMQGRSRIFGWMPRRPLRNDFCHISQLALENADSHYAVCAYAEQISTWYQRYNPALFAQHEGLMQEKIAQDYRLPDAPKSIFTSGVVNKNNSLPYHFDAGNFKDVWSCMLVFKNQTAGGHLSVPELDIGFELKNNSLFMFDGQGILHGVTPIKLLSRKAYRYSVVYYSLQQMWKCLPITDEIIRIRQKKTEREQKRYHTMKGQQHESD